MKKITFGLITGLLTFGVGLLSIGIRSRPLPGRPVKSIQQTKSVPSCPLPADLQEIQDVEFRELMLNPDRYDGRLVRTRAIMIGGGAYEPLFDHVYLSCEGCEAMLFVHDQFHLTSRTCPEVLQALDSLLMQTEPPYEKRSARVTVVGRFTSSRHTILRTGQSHLETERFTIIAVERAASMDDDE